MITFILILDFCSHFTQIASAYDLNAFQIKFGLLYHPYQLKHEISRDVQGLH